MIDKTYVINLVRRKDKREHMEKEFKKLKENGTDLHHIFFDAIDGNNDGMLSQYKFNIPNWFDPNSGKAMTNGEVGCALSHYLVWKDIITSVENKSLPENCKILIVEDDVIFPNDFLEKLDQYTSEINITYDMLYIHRKPLNLQEETKLSTHINIIRKSYWTCGYILTYSGTKKLVSANYLDNLIPVDEFLPIMYGCNVFGFEKLYEQYEKIKCYAICPNLLKLTSSAFCDSETFHSQPFLSNEYYRFDNGKEFVIIYIGPIIGHSYERFIDYCRLYALPYIPINNENTNSQAQLLKNELESWPQDKLNSTLVLVISIYPNDQCNIIPIASPGEIVNKFLAMAKDNRNIITIKKETENRKSLFCGWAPRILEFASNSFENMNKSINNDVSLSVLLTINSFINNDIICDNDCQIFHPLNETNTFNFNHGMSRIINSQSKTMPCIVFANSNNAIIQLNRIENYTGNNWNEYYGYRITNIRTILPNIYMSFYIGKNNNILKILDKLDYPKEKLTITINKIGITKKTSPETMYNEEVYGSENELFQTDISKFLISDCDYYFFVSGNCILDNPMVLKELLNLNKTVVAPLLRKGDKAWTNFWGDLDEKGYYKRSFDYFDIIEHKKQGCWNVPYITGTYLIKKEILKAVPNLFTENDDMDLDMRMCHNLREYDVFMYVSNISVHGYIQDVPDIIEILPEKNGDVTLYDIFTRRQEWERKYLHPDYYQHKNNLEKLGYTEVCHDIYTFPLFSQDFCSELIERTEAYGKWSKGKDEHNDPRLGQNYYENVPTVDIQLFEIKLDKQWHEIVFSYIVPMNKLLYNNYKTKDINLAFVVKYNYKDQSSLAPHHDSSTYTVNIALNRGNGVDYENGGCRFIRQNYVLKDQEPGTCCMHPGRLTAYHEGLPITAGTRYILVSFIN